MSGAAARTGNLRKKIGITNKRKKGCVYSGNQITTKNWTATNRMHRNLCEN